MQCKFVLLGHEVKFGLLPENRGMLKNELFYLFTLKFNQINPVVKTIISLVLHLPPFLPGMVHCIWCQQAVLSFITAWSFRLRVVMSQAL